jgi:hypothetical protein
MLGDARYCYPLTVTDHASRFLLLCEALELTREDPAITAFEQLFRERGLPLAIRSENGVPFASPNGLFNLSKLSVWWLRLGIAIERIKPGHPQHMARTRNKLTARPPRALQARRARDVAEKFVQSGQDPIAARDDERRAQIGKPTFGQMAGRCGRS